MQLKVEPSLACGTHELLAFSFCDGSDALACGHRAPLAGAADLHSEPGVRRGACRRSHSNIAEFKPHATRRHIESAPHIQIFVVTHVRAT
eukprot:6179968-Pleurochrysis_carterae.AAC.2